MKYKCYGVPKQGKDVCFDNCFTIHIPYGYLYYATPQDEIEKDTDDKKECGYIIAPSDTINGYSENLLYIDKEEYDERFIISKVAHLEIEDGSWKNKMDEFLDGMVEKASIPSDDDNMSDGKNLFRDDFCGVIRYHQHVQVDDTEKLSDNLFQKTTVSAEVYNAIIASDKNVYYAISDDYGIGIFKVNDKKGDELFKSLRSLNSEKTSEESGDNEVKDSSDRDVEMHLEDESSLKGVRFFMHSDVFSWILNNIHSQTKASVTFGIDDSFSFDDIDQPVHCFIKGQGDAVSFGLCIRSEMGAFEENPDIRMNFYMDEEKKPDGNASGRIENAAQTIMAFIDVAGGIRNHILSNQIMENYPDFDEEKEGIIIELKNDTLEFTRVAGRKRPSLACTTLFEGVKKCRPYFDELSSSMMVEMQSFEELLEAAEDGDEAAMEAVAQKYLNGDEDEEIKPQAEKAVQWFEKLAELDDATSQYNLALLTAKGHGTKRDFSKAAYWMKRAAENGDEDAIRQVDEYVKIAEAVNKAESGDAQAQADIAGFLMKMGGSVFQAETNDDYLKCIEWAKKSAEQGNGDGIWILALAYEHGRGVKENKAKAIELYTKGANSGHASSMNSIACYYLRGEVKGKTKKDAFDLFKTAAEKGNVDAMRNLGHCYQFEDGTEYDMSQAIKWYEKYLEYRDDPELEKKVAVFKTLPDISGVIEDEPKPEKKSSSRTQGSKEKTKAKPVVQKQKSPQELRKEKDVLALSKITNLAEEFKKLNQKLIEEWQDRLENIQEEISSKEYLSQDEVIKDMKSLVIKRNRFGEKLDSLLDDLDKEAKSILDSAGDYRAVNIINGLIDEIFEESSALNLNFSMTGSLEAEIGSAEFNMSDSSNKIKSYWKNKYQKMPEFRDAAKKAQIEEEISGLKKMIDGVKSEIANRDGEEKRLKEEIPCLEQKANELESRFDSERKRILEEAENEIEEQKKNIENTITEKTELEKQVRDLSTELNGLSFFKKSLKKELSQKIDSLKDQIQNLQSKNRNQEEHLDSIKKRRDEDVKNKEKQVEDLFVQIKDKKVRLEEIPDSKKKDEQKIYELSSELELKQKELAEIVDKYEDGFFDNLQKEINYKDLSSNENTINSSAVSGVNPQLQEVLLALSECDGSSVDELMTQTSIGKNMTNQRLSALLRKLVDEGKVEKRIEGKKARFYLC